LSWHQRIAVVQELDLPLSHVVGESNVVVWS
jgi:hypothetical protein